MSTAPQPTVILTLRRVLDQAARASLRAAAGEWHEGGIVAEADGGAGRRVDTAYPGWPPGVRERLEAVLLPRVAGTWGFAVDAWEAPQLLRYGPGDGYGWHIDLGPGPAARRKLSVTVLLSDPDDFAGGDLEFDGGVALPRERGAALVFPSFLRHRVAPVLAGERWALVAWLTGPPLV